MVIVLLLLSLSGSSVTLTTPHSPPMHVKLLWKVKNSNCFTLVFIVGWIKAALRVPNGRFHEIES